MYTYRPVRHHIYKICLACRHVMIRSLAPADVLFIELWSDGKYETQITHDLQIIMKCPYCQRLVWFVELWNSKYEINLDHFDVEFVDVAHCQVPTFDDFDIYLQHSEMNAQAERYVRIQAWWAANDVRRGSNLTLQQKYERLATNPVKPPPPPPRWQWWKPVELHSVFYIHIPLTDRERENLERLLALLDESDESQCVTKAEVLRQLSRFAEARALLRRVRSKKYMRFVHVLKRHIKNRNPELVLVG